MDLQLRDTVAIVTGSSRGLGLASAAALAAEGARVVICGRDRGRLEAASVQVAAAAGPSGVDRVLAVPIDLSTAEGPAALVEQAVARFGGVDVLVNNVGMAKGAGLVDTPDAAWQEALDYTLYPAVRASRAAVPHMIGRGGGSIVLIASIYGRGLSPWRLVAAKPRVIEPDYPRPDVGSYMLFVGPDADWTGVPPR